MITIAFSKLLLIWLALTATLLIVSGRSQKRLDIKTLSLAILGSTVFTAVIALFPPAQKPQLRNLAGGWLRNFIIFTALIHYAVQSTRRQSAVSGLVFATTVTLLELLA